MGEFSKFERGRKLGDGLEKPTTTKYNLFETYGTVAVRSMLPANVYRTGQVTGKQYYWAGAGTVIEVDERDIPHLLSLSVAGQSCCGQNRNAFYLFERA